MTIIIDHSEKKKPPYLVYTFDDDFTLNKEDMVLPEDIPVASDASPKMDGTAAAGTGADYSRADHVHPSDTGKADAVHTHDASAVVSGAFDTARIPSLAASKITSGTFDAARIPSLDASKIASGTFDAARLPNATASTKGAVIPDDVTIGIADGTISAKTTTISYATSSTVNAANNTYTTILEKSPGKGTWLCIGTIRFGSNATGTRSARIDSVSGAGSAVPGRETVSAVSGDATILNTMRVLTLASDEDKVYLTANQNSGSTIACAGQMECTRLA